MSEKLLSEAIINVNSDRIAEKIADVIIEGTEQTDIAQQANKYKLAKTAISLSLPYMIGYKQRMDGPAAFVFGLVNRYETKINQQSADHRPANPDDQIITRKLMETEVRTVKLQMTNEAAQDIQALFGNDFDKHFQEFQASGGEIWKGPNPNVAQFFLDIGMRRMANKINTDFAKWCLKTATKKGTMQIPTMMDIPNIFAGIGELKEALFKATQKSGRTFILVSPRIAAFMSATLGSTMSSGATSFELGKPIPNDTRNGFVMQAGDMMVYQYDFSQLTAPDKIDPEVVGGMTPPTESEDKGYIIMGYMGDDADSASVYYAPYSEYLVQSEDYSTGQPTVWYKVRDTWCTNPLDTYDDSMTKPQLGITGNEPKDNTSSFLMMCEVDFAEKLIQP